MAGHLHCITVFEDFIFSFTWDMAQFFVSVHVELGLYDINRKLLVNPVFQTLVAQIIVSKIDRVDAQFPPLTKILSISRNAFLNNFTV